MRELTSYVAVSLDGYIAGPGGEFDAFLAEGDHMAAIWERYAQGGRRCRHLAGRAGVLGRGPSRNRYARGQDAHAAAHTTHIVAKGRASSRPSGIAVPHTTHTP